MREKLKVGQKLQKNWDGSIVTIKKIDDNSITLDGDFEPNHVVMLWKVNSYYTIIKDDEGDQNG